MSICAICVKAGYGRDFPWKSDHAYVKVSKIQSQGHLSLIEDNMTTGSNHI